MRHNFFIQYPDTEQGRLLAAEYVDRWFRKEVIGIPLWSALYDRIYNGEPTGEVGFHYGHFDRIESEVSQNVR